MINRIFLLLIFLYFNCFSKVFDEKLILENANNQNKQILVYATSPTCYFCKKMEKEVLSKKMVIDKMNKYYLFIKVNIDNEKLPFSLNKNYKGMTPTSFILSKKGVVLNTYPGAWTKKDFLDILEENHQ